MPPASGQSTPASETAWVTMGNPDEQHPQLLATAARGRGIVKWTVPSKATRGDRVLFYITGVQQLVARGSLRDRADRIDSSHGPFGAIIENVEMIRPIDLSWLRTEFPEWGWAKSPRHAARIPDDVATELFTVLDDNAALDTDRGALENVLTERRILARSRNRAARDRCVEASAGVCAGCQYDYAAIAPTSWRSILQAHHKRPLHLSDGTRDTTARDLTPFCPTCHVIAHLRRPTPYTAANVAARYAGKSFNP